ncbi:MAG: hypothetical protein RXO36_04285 [Candidatus Nanopusillus acidilobi]
MMPIYSLEELFKFVDSNENKDLFVRKYLVYSFFLYSTEHKNIGKYIREHFDELFSMSGRNCLVFFIDREKSIDEKRAEEYWDKCGLKNEFIEEFKKTKPYDPGEIYRIAEKFKIPPKDIPSIVFLPSLKSKEIVYYKLKDDLSPKEMTEIFQEIFSEVGEAIESIKKGDESIEEIWRKFKRKLEQRNRRINRLNDIMVEIEPVLVILNRSIGEILRGFLLP